MGMGRRTALLAQGVVGQHERRSGGQHRIDQQQCLAFEASARDVLDLHGELAVLGALAIGRDEGVLGVVEVVEKPLMIGKSRTENRRHHDLLVDHLDGGFTQRRLDNARFVAERFRYFVGRDLADALHVAAETHRIPLNPLVADFCDEFVENGVLLGEDMQRHG